MMKDKSVYWSMIDWGLRADDTKKLKKKLNWVTEVLWDWKDLEWKLENE
jgi:hypothetical protein